jgi:hypothetical protein
MTKPIAFLVALVAMLTATEARAQHFFHHGKSHRVAVAGTAPGGTVAGYPSTVARSGYSVVAPGYGGLGYNDFPFSGKFYGRPYDPWTWPYMSGAYGRGLARYYDPPVK